MSLMLSCTSALVEDDLPITSTFNLVAATYTTDGFTTIGFNRTPPGGSISPDDPINGAFIDSLDNAQIPIPAIRFFFLFLIGIHPQNHWDTMSITGLHSGGQRTVNYNSATMNFQAGGATSAWSLDPIDDSGDFLVTGQTYSVTINWTL